MNFVDFKEAVREQIQCLSLSDRLFITNIDKDTVWDTYLDSFPEGTNPIFRERTEHDCSCCKQFIKKMGNVVGIKDHKIISIWDISIGGYYQEVADKLNELITSGSVINVFLTNEKSIGVDKNREIINDSVHIWEHFQCDIPKKFRSNNLGKELGDAQSSRYVFFRGLKEITSEAASIVIELIEQDSIYRGQEHLKSVKEFLQMKKQFDKLITIRSQENFTWVNFSKHNCIKNTVIGTLLVDISEGVELNKAVASFESKVAPQNYKRPKPIITKRMIKEAQKTVDKLGLTSALDRRHAKISDLTINNVLFADRSAKQEMNVFDCLESDCISKPQKFDSIEEIHIDAFIKDILPKIKSMELFFENKHENNLFSLTAPVDPSAKQLFKWPNNFSWSYNGNMADSIREKVKKAGGSVTGYLRFSLSWFNTDDLDIHVIEPDGFEIMYLSKKSHNTKGNLDIDVNSTYPYTKDPVENIVWPNKNKLMSGKYEVYVHNYAMRDGSDFGFEIEYEYDKNIGKLVYDKPVKHHEKVPVATIFVDNNKNITITPKIKEGETMKTLWNINTNTFHKVNLVMFSPNFWDDMHIGNKHYMFAIENCKNPDDVRGFFNEYLSKMEWWRMAMECSRIFDNC